MNDPTKVNITEKPKEKVGQPSNNSMEQQCSGCQGYGHRKSECLTYLRSKGKVPPSSKTHVSSSIFDFFTRYYSIE